MTVRSFHITAVFLSSHLNFKQTKSQFFKISDQIQLQFSWWFKTKQPTTKKGCLKFAVSLSELGIF